VKSSEGRASRAWIAAGAGKGLHAPFNLGVRHIVATARDRGQKLAAELGGDLVFE